MRGRGRIKGKSEGQGHTQGYSAESRVRGTKRVRVRSQGSRVKNKDMGQGKRQDQGSGVRN